jgi:NYN domain-containing protein
MPRRTIVYVDGFNLYYRALKDTPFKWLDLRALFTALLPANQIATIKYYTANVSSAISPGGPARQQFYLAALGTLPEVQIFKGNFLVNTVWGHLNQPVRFKPDSSTINIIPPPKKAWIVKAEEKGSDVNLASHLVNDGWKNIFDAAVVVSNDTDLVEPIRIVVQELKKPVGVLFPVKKPATSLVNAATFIKIIRAKHLAAAQFSNPLKDKLGRVIHKPATW